MTIVSFTPLALSVSLYAWENAVFLLYWNRRCCLFISADGSPHANNLDTFVLLCTVHVLFGYSQPQVTTHNWSFQQCEVIFQRFFAWDKFVQGIGRFSFSDSFSITYGFAQSEKIVFWSSKSWLQEQGNVFVERLKRSSSRSSEFPCNLFLHFYSTLIQSSSYSFSKVWINIWLWRRCFQISVESWTLWIPLYSDHRIQSKVCLYDVILMNYCKQHILCIQSTVMCCIVLSVCTADKSGNNMHRGALQQDVQYKHVYSMRNLGTYCMYILNMCTCTLYTCTVCNVHMYTFYTVQL